MVIIVIIFLSSSLSSVDFCYLCQGAHAEPMQRSVAIYHLSLSSVDLSVLSKVTTVTIIITMIITIAIINTMIISTMVTVIIMIIFMMMRFIIIIIIIIVSIIVLSHAQSRLSPPESQFFSLFLSLTLRSSLLSLAHHHLTL